MDQGLSITENSLTLTIVPTDTDGNLPNNRLTRKKSSKRRRSRKGKKTVKDEIDQKPIELSLEDALPEPKPRVCGFLFFMKKIVFF